MKPSSINIKFKCWLLAVSAFFVTALSESDVKAQVAASQWNGPGDYIYDVHSMPDLDQERAGLDNNGGMHCVPTAVMNLLAYCANFGFDEMPPYPGVWIGAPGHGEMTGWIDWLGQYMGTSGDLGTSGSGKVAGLTNWIEDSGSPIFFAAKFRTDDDWPTIDDAALYATCGAIVQFSYGRYDWQYGTQGPPELVARDGGHAVTLKLAFADNGWEEGNRLIHYRDPATDEGNLNSNSNFSSVWPATARNMNIGMDVDDDGLAEFFTMTALKYPVAPGEQYQILDSILAIFPPGGVAVGGNTVSGVFQGGKLGFVQDQIPVPYSPTAERDLIAAIPHPDQHSTLLLEGVLGRHVELVQVTHTGSRHRFMSVVDRTQFLATGPDDEIYLGTDNDISLIKGVADGSVRPIRIGTTTSRISGIGVDPASGSVLVIHGRRAQVLPRGASTWIDLGLCLGVGRDQEPFRNISIAHGRIYAALKSGKVVSAAYPTQPAAGRPLSFAPLALAGIRNAQHVDSDGVKRLYVSDSVQGLLEFERTRTGSWQRAQTRWFAGVSPKSRFIPFRNRTNIRAAELDESQWYNIDPRELVPLGPEISD